MLPFMPSLEFYLRNSLLTVTRSINLKFLLHVNALAGSGRVKEERRRWRRVVLDRPGTGSTLKAGAGNLRLLPPGEGGVSCPERGSAPFEGFQSALTATLFMPPPGSFLSWSVRPKRFVHSCWPLRHWKCSHPAGA